jgi:very-short-patch-repair endonuclease
MSRYLTECARELRRQETPAERELWRWLRGRKLGGFKFRRQHPLGLFIADFYCLEALLVIEADGAWHYPSPRRDQARDRLFAAAGLTVLRFENREILENTAAVLERIRQSLPPRDAVPLPSPLGRGAGGEGQEAEGQEADGQEADGQEADD